MLDGAPTLTVEGDAESDASSDAFTISKDFDLSALLARRSRDPGHACWVGQPPAER
jgi:hypothetical protein